jgi:hypothetical protein
VHTHVKSISVSRPDYAEDPFISCLDQCIFGILAHYPAFLWPIIRLITIPLLLLGKCSCDNGGIES